MIKFEKADMVTVSRKALEGLLTAPAGCLKIYIYGCIHDSADMKKIMSDLDMSKNEFLDSIEYLQKGGYINVDVTSDTTFTYAAVEEAPKNSGPVYPDAQFNGLLQSLFSDRELGYRELKTFYECTEVFGLPKKVVLMLAEYCIAGHKRGNRLPMQFITEKAREWAKQGIDSVEAAERKMNADRSYGDGAKKVLSWLGITGREPSVAERALYEKWTTEWMFEPELIYSALERTTSTHNPSMKYLDSILKALYDEDITTKEQAERYFAEKERTDEEVKRLLSALASPSRTVSEDYRSILKKYKDAGYGMDMLIYACKKASAAGRHNLAGMEEVLLAYKDKGITMAEEAQRSDADLKRTALLTKEMLVGLGIEKTPGASEIAAYRRYSKEYGFDHELIIFAAKKASEYKNPAAALNSIMRRWNETGVKTLSDAKAADESFRNRSNSDNKTDFPQREYSESDYNERMRRAVESLGSNFDDDFRDI